MRSGGDPIARAIAIYWASPNLNRCLHHGFLGGSHSAVPIQKMLDAVLIHIMIST